jgi:hypothetical protein
MPCYHKFFMHHSSPSAKIRTKPSESHASPPLEGATQSSSKMAVAFSRIVCTTRTCRLVSASWAPEEEPMREGLFMRFRVSSYFLIHH